jgi:NAD(P)-dependent dehydrogenase (short-subunit alcohol dehydrogenase family)
MLTLKDKKMLITGELGMLGSTVALRCLSLGARVTVLDAVCRILETK